MSFPFVISKVGMSYVSHSPIIKLPANKCKFSDTSPDGLIINGKVSVKPYMPTFLI